MPKRTNNLLIRADSSLWLLIVCLVIGLWFLWPYFGVIALALIAAYLANPLYRFLKGKMSRSIAVSLTFLISLIVVGLPLLILIILTVNQTIQLVDDISNQGLVIDGRDVTVYLQDAVAGLNRSLESITGARETISESGLNEFIRNTLPNIINAVGRALLNILSGIPSFITNSILFIFIFSGSLLGQEKLINLLKNLSPFDKKATAMYGQRTRGMIKAMVKGQLIIAFCQAIVGATSLILVGLGNYFFFFVFLFTFLNLIPLGSGMLVIPIGIFAALTGDVFGGIVILLVHFLIVTNIDNVLRPMLVPKDSSMPAALLLLSVFAGVMYFGILGIVIGPVIMIVLKTTFELIANNTQIKQGVV